MNKEIIVAIKKGKTNIAYKGEGLESILKSLSYEEEDILDFELYKLGTPLKLTYVEVNCES